MRLIDLSQPLYDNAPNCPVHPPVSFRRTADHPADGWRMEEIAMATHTGSHLDAPLHKIAGGKSIDALPLETFVGPARIADLRGLTAVRPSRRSCWRKNSRDSQRARSCCSQRAGVIGVASP